MKKVISIYVAFFLSVMLAFLLGVWISEWFKRPIAPDPAGPHVSSSQAMLLGFMIYALFTILLTLMFSFFFEEFSRGIVKLGIVLGIIFSLVYFT
ncbi:MAG TPA: hypothetical protein VNB90_06630 [Cytophagaceae bacterium]|jgi:hypothetical protein|nr:hypothetical protein [Cytophagaceae bacterium]